LFALLDRTDAPLEERIAAGFALGKLLDEDDQFDEAFAYYAAANDLHRQSQAQAGIRFEFDKFREQIDQTIQVFTRRFFDERPDWASHQRFRFLLLECHDPVRRSSSKSHPAIPMSSAPEN